LPQFAFEISEFFKLFRYFAAKQAVAFARCADSNDNEATVSNNGPQDSNAVGRVNRDGAGSKTVATPKPVVRLDAGEILASVGEALYRWDIESDVLVWSANIGDVLLVRDVRAISSGRAYRAAPRSRERAGALRHRQPNPSKRDDGHGVAYQIEYRIRPDAGVRRTRLWVEDTGRWFAGPDGRNRRVRMVRVARHQ
jgi:PAS domain-containing protein